MTKNEKTLRQYLQDSYIKKKTDKIKLLWRRKDNKGESFLFSIPGDKKIFATIGIDSFINIYTNTDTFNAKEYGTE